MHGCKIFRNFLFLFALLLFMASSSAHSSHETTKEIILKVQYKKVNFGGRWKYAIAVNNQIPGPTLHFKLNDHVTIHVYNYINKPVTIHWHGVLVPWQMDGVEGVSQQGIPPQGVFHYHFTLEQSGTYWYHAHSQLQEQEGLYGAFIIDPIHKPKYSYTKNFELVLSDWSNLYADCVLANLKKDGDYFSSHFPLQPSLLKFIHDFQKANVKERCELIHDYQTMQKMRMSLYDLSDVAYDAFLLNGRTASCPWKALVKVGDIVRLRFIGASSSTLFRVKIPDASMQLVHVDGNDVVQQNIEEFTIAPGETFDVLLKIEKNKPYVIYGESTDKVGVVIGALVTSPDQLIDYRCIHPFPEPLRVTQEMMKNMSDMGSEHMNHDEHHMQMKHHEMPTEPTVIGDSICPIPCKDFFTKGTKYQNLTAAITTNNPKKSVDGIIRMELFGYMDRYIWFINGLPEYKVKPIQIKPNKRYRIIFTNKSMMHHPMHIHGHWFILRNGHGKHDPLLHTIDAAPGSTIVADVDTDASGQWFFHCHHLYHMMGGMSRVIQYNTIIEVVNGEIPPENEIYQQPFYNRPIVRIDEQIPIERNLVCHPMGHAMGLYSANFLDIGIDPFHNVQEMNFKGLYGSDYHKLELLIKDAEVDKGSVDDADIDIFYWHLISQFWAVKGGVNYFYQPTLLPYWQPGIGIEGTLPYFIDTDLRGYFHSGSAKLDAEFSRDSQITNNFFIRAGIRSIFATKTIRKDQIGSGLNQLRYTLRPFYRLCPGINIFAEFEHDQDYGNFRKLQRQQGEDVSENTLTFGLAWVF